MHQDRKEYSDSNFARVRGTNLLADLLQLPSFYLQFSSLCHPLLQQHMYNLPSDMYTGNNYNRYLQLKKQAPTKSSTSFRKIFFGKMVVWELVLGVTLSIIAAITSFGGPVIIKYILVFIKNQNATNQDQTKAYQYVASWSVLFFLRIYVKVIYQKIFMKISLKADQILSVLILSKVLKLSSSYKIYLEKGDIINHLINDVYYVRQSIQTIGMLFNALATLIAVQCFLFSQAGIYGLTLIGVLAVGALIQYFLQSRMSKVRLKKLNVFEERVGTNLELLGSIKHLKLLGWERLLPMKNLEYLRKQNKYNKIYYLLTSVFELIINVFPTLAILLIFVIELVSGGGNFDTVTAYTMISVVGMIYTPAKQLFNQIIQTIDGNNALRRINHLLQAEEMKPLQQALDLKEGDLQIKNLVMSWESEQSHRHFIKKEKLTLNQKEDDKDDNNEDEISVFNTEKHDSEESEFNILKDLRATIKKPTINCKEFSVGDFDIVLEKGQRLVVLGFPVSGKTTFINTILGNVNILKGYIKYRGKIGYVSQKTWCKNQTIRANVLMGRKENIELLNKVYHMAELDVELNFLSQKDRTRMTDSNSFSEGQKRRICIARALYGEPDILLMDDPFMNLDNETSKIIYNRISDGLPNSLIITATHSASIIRPTDRVIILENGHVKEYDIYTRLKSSPLLHKLIEITPQQQYNDAYRQQQEKIVLQRLEGLEMSKVHRERMKRCIKQIIELGKTLVSKDFAAELKKKGEKERGLKLESKRVDCVPTEFYWRLWSSSKLEYILLMFLVAVTYSIKVYSDWWLGQLTIMTNYSAAARLLIYSGLILGFGCTFGLASMCHLWTSNRVSQQIIDKSCTSLVYSKLSWFQDQKIIKVANRISKDFDKFYNLHSTLQNIFKNITLLLATLVLVTCSSWIFLPISIVMIIINTCILYYFMRAERELWVTGLHQIDQLNNHYEETINSIEYIRAYGHLDKPVDELIRLSYRVTVFRQNYFGIFKTMEILSQVVSLALMTCVALMAVTNKFNGSIDTNIIGITITFSMKIADMMTSLIKDVARLEMNMKVNMVRQVLAQKPKCELIGKNQEEGYDIPGIPQMTLRDGSIRFEKVSLRYPTISFPIIKEVSFEIKSGENIMICGSQDNGKNLILEAIEKLCNPVKNFDGSVGDIYINNINLNQVGRKYITQYVMYINSTPFIFTSSIRENLDPFSEHSEEEIVEALKKVKLWEAIEVQYECSLNERENKLGFILKDAGANLSVGILQKLNLARALLRKPLILLCESTTSSIDPETEREVGMLIKNEFKTSTLIEITQSISPIMDSDRVFYFANGNIKEADKPLDLLKKGGHFANMVQTLEPQLYYKLMGNMTKKAQKRVDRRSRRASDMEALLRFL